MRANDTLDEADFRKITLREFAEAAPTAAPLTADDIRALREDAHMSQAVFAKYLNLTAGHHLPDGARIETANRPSIGVTECDTPQRHRSSHVMHAIVDTVVPRPQRADFVFPLRCYSAAGHFCAPCKPRITSTFSPTI